MTDDGKTFSNVSAKSEQWSMKDIQRVNEIK